MIIIICQCIYLSIETDVWRVTRRVTNVQLMSSYMHGAVMVNNYMIVIGGVGLSDSPAAVHLSVYDSTCNHWTHITHLSAGKLSLV